METPRPVMPSEAQQAESVEFAAQLFARAKQTPRWPMYVRQIRQYFRNADETFDERKLGFPGIVEFLRACQKDGLLRLERDRQGVMRVFPGAKLQRPAAAPVAEPGNAAEPMSATRQPGDEPELPLDDAAPRSVFTRVTDDVPGAVERPLAATTTDEEDLSVGPGNVEQNDSLMPVRAGAEEPCAASGENSGFAANRCSKDSGAAHCAGHPHAATQEAEGLRPSFTDRRRHVVVFSQRHHSPSKGWSRSGNGPACTSVVWARRACTTWSGRSSTTRWTRP